MKARNDTETVELTERYINALREVLAAEVEMMQAAWGPEEARYWHWGRAVISDLCRTDGVKFLYGAEEDMPDDGLGRFGVRVEHGKER